ncbi:MAG TPA: hypothetical protein VG820_03520 [Fimbriimonadaceae bacterium]|nr:hypothetical protein [Fimbriimonadaceae bacterium]
MLVRLDHVIFSVPDIEAAHRELTSRFPEAWPIGRFWPDGRTSGIAIGGINLELVQPDEAAPTQPVGATLAFEPFSPEVAEFTLRREGLACHRFDKIEPDHDLLRLRGFSEQAGQTPQLICENVLLDEPGEASFDFFTCSYSPFLKEWLSPDHPRLRTQRRITRIRYATPWPEQAASLLAKLDYQGEIQVQFVPGERKAIVGIETDDGPLGWP